MASMTLPNPTDVLINTLTTFDHSSITSNNQRRRLLDAAETLCRQIETPMEVMLRIAWSDPAYLASLKTCIDVKLFHALGEGGKESSKTVGELAEATGVDATLLLRLIRVLVAKGTIKEVGEGIYSPTPLALALRDPQVSAAIDYRYSMMDKMYLSYPFFLQKTAYQNPCNSAAGPWQFATQSDESFFTWLGQRPDCLETFANLMSGYTSQRGTWDEIYPVQDKLLPDETFNCPNDTILVDIGGGLGHDLQRFAKRFLAEHHRVVLLDKPEVIEKAKSNGRLPKNIQAFEIDFLKQTPVSGARAYYLHSVLHDWADEDAITILRQIRPAVLQKTVDGYIPKLLINENVIPKTGAKEQQVVLDIVMSMGFASHERTESDWRKLLESAGYIITGIFSSPEVDEAVIEAVAIVELN